MDQLNLANVDPPFHIYSWLIEMKCNTPCEDIKRMVFVQLF